MDRQKWLEWLSKETEVPFEGWDFSYVGRTGRLQEAPLSWNYASLVTRKLPKITTLLDMGTGGGEFLSLLGPLPRQTYATEGYQPNVAVARNRLEPLGITVVEADGEDTLPFPDETFDLIINRHESFDPHELYRIAKSGATFLTQQVGGENDVLLNRLLGAAIPQDYLHWRADYAVRQLEEAGFVIAQSREETVPSRFYDIGAVVYYLRAIPWQIPDFAPEVYADGLWQMHQQIEKDGYIDIPSHRFLIEAVRR
ncbi:class I SAM-dependent methyltransferase [Brevibacillus ruminantium]|uniref:Class I SAM-dependent methyltransferase n=1 Tax=Brevibacillus ruminantium TaxID=2950604 RepID=A0ABY4WFZ4_9BACL|nr:class I SAM-dependent methyltransferase [Brevibacillus ruminantium]USG64937.1 class I SAM-dependent methyltransferase [Brevibacillus ruminantium]